MRKLRAIQGDEVLIVDASEGSLSHMFENIFGEHRSDVEVVKASPDFLAKLP